MADQKYGSTEIRQYVFQQFQSFCVEVICGFIQHQHIRWLRHHLCQQQSVPLSTAEKSDQRVSPIGRKQKVLQKPHHMAFLAVDHQEIRPVTDVFSRTFRFIQLVPQLIEVPDGLVGSQPHSAGCR